MRSTYKLPAEWGGALIEATYRGMDAGRHIYDGVQGGVGGYRLGFANKLEEVRPPSIDDPVEFPLDMADMDGYRLGIGASEVPGALLAIRVTGRSGSYFTFDAEPHQALRLAQVAWQAWQRSQQATS